VKYFLDQKTFKIIIFRYNTFGFSNKAYGDKLLFGIDIVDPGAVPGASTILWGRYRIDTYNKGIVFARYDTTDYGSHCNKCK